MSAIPIIKKEFIMKRFIKKNPVIFTVIVVLLTVISMGVLTRLTDGFTEFDPQVVFTPDRNEDNLLFEKYKSFDQCVDSNGVTFENKNDVIYIDGQISDKDTASDAVLKLTSVELEPGVYTYTCFKNPTATTYYSYLIWETGNGNKHVVFGDFKNTSLKIEGATTEGCKTFEITEKVNVDVMIVACKDTTFYNVKAMPCIVPGDDAGDFYAK